MHGRYGPGSTFLTRAGRAIGSDLLAGGTPLVHDVGGYSRPWTGEVVAVAERAPRSFAQDVKAANRYISDRLREARGLLEAATGRGAGERISIADVNARASDQRVVQAFEKMGLAVHITQDATSPSHEGGQSFVFLSPHCFLENHYPNDFARQVELRAATRQPVLDVLEGTIREAYLDSQMRYAPGDAK
jgi:hypothetical protein